MNESDEFRGFAGFLGALLVIAVLFYGMAKFAGYL